MEIKSNMEDSVDKWICDRTHIQNYKIDSDRWVKVGNLSISKYKKSSTLRSNDL